MIGALSHAIRGAAIDAILTGTEAITKKSLAAVPLDHSAQSPAPPPGPVGERVLADPTRFFPC
jgi:hypothetical protein